MATGKDTVRTSSNGTSLRLLQITFLCSVSFTTWRMAFIKQAPFPIHRTLHETFGARHPSSVFFGNRFRSADYQKIQLPPGGSQGRIVRIRPRFYKTITAYCNPSAAAAAAPLSGALFSLPPLGEVPRSGKGGVVGDFELLPFNEQHPLSQPCRFRSAVKSASSPNGGAKWAAANSPGIS